MKTVKTTLLTSIAGCALALLLPSAQADVNPNLPFYGWGTIVSTPAYPIVGEEAQIAVTIGNSGTEEALNVQVRISFNDWGATFAGWQEIATVTIPSIPAGGTAVATATHTFETMAHTCVEAIIVGSNQNDNEFDDRGQINLEVVSADGLFAYQVPVRNEGDQPLNLLVVGHCEGQDGTANGDRFCKNDPMEVQLDPGEEILVPVEIDLRAVPPGGAINFVLDAYDLGADDPFAPDNHNHIVLRVVRVSAKNLKQKALTTVEAVSSGVTKKSLKNQIDSVANHIKLALASGAWTAPSALSADGGAKVFAQEASALNKLVQLLGSDLPVAEKAALNSAALQLTDADRILAQNAAGTNAAARALVDEGDLHRAAGEYHKAVLSYKNAWDVANN